MSEQARAETIRWGAGPVAFELRSSVPDVVHHARTTFGAWQPETENLLGTWTISTDGEQLTVDPLPESADESFEHRVTQATHAVAMVEYAAIARIFEHSNDVLTFHAAMLSNRGRAVAIVGPSCAGKSTLATALWHNGWYFHCDDLTMVRGRAVWPGPRRVGLRRESRPLLGETLWNRILSSDSCLPTGRGALFLPQELDPRTPQNNELAGIFFLNRLGADDQTLAPTPLLPAHAAMAILPYTNLIRRFSFQEAFLPVGELMSRVPAWDLPRAPLDEMVRSVNQLVLERDGD
jgi:hypothetical protein